jgi:hypothetical protein
MIRLSWEEAYQNCLTMGDPDVVEAAIIQGTWCIAQFVDHVHSMSTALQETLHPSDPAEWNQFSATMKLALEQILDLYHECMKNKMDPAS